MTLPTHTPNFNIPIPRPGQRFFQDEYAAGFMVFDSTLALYISVNNFVGVWDNSTAYTATQTVVDAIAGGVWRCDQSHTSPASPTTFAAYRAANPAVWTNATLEVRNRGIWASATQYRVGDFLATAASNGKIAICLVAHTSGATFAADLALGYWSVLVDLTSYVTSPFLGSVAAINPMAADRIVYSSAADTAAATAITAFGRTWIALADAAAGLSNLGAADAVHVHAGTDITSGTVAAARLGSGTPSSANFLRGDSSWTTVATTQTIEAITGNDTLVAADSGTCFRVTADCTIALTAAATLGAGWWCDIMIDGDYNDLRIVTIDPNSTEEIDEQTSIKSYLGEKYRIYCTGALFRTYGRSGDVFIGEMAVPQGDDTANLYSDGAIFDDPELSSFHLQFTQLSHNDAAASWGMQLLDTSGTLINTNITWAQFTDYSTPTGADTTTGSNITPLSGSLNATDPFDMVVDIDVLRAGSGYTIGKIQAHSAAVVPTINWFRHATPLGGIRLNISDGTAAIDGGSVQIWAKRQRRS